MQSWTFRSTKSMCSMQMVQHKPRISPNENSTRMLSPSQEPMLQPNQKSVSKLIAFTSQLSLATGYLQPVTCNRFKKLFGYPHRSLFHFRRIQPNVPGSRRFLSQFFVFFLILPSLSMVLGYRKSLILLLLF